MIDNHIRALRKKHAGLDQKISEEERRPAPNDALLSMLKKEKLKIKEELAQAV